MYKNNLGIVFVFIYTQILFVVHKNLNIMRIFLIIIISLSFQSLFNAQEIVDNYLDTYSPIAIEEMERTGIPASIKLAQGLLESDFGRSELAVFAYNHFGIKCGGNWTGRSYHKEDDERDENGKLKDSCFRVFDSGEDSYRSHSEFLLRNARYEFLFEYESYDYKSWARGLKKAGYATDPSYPKKLIGVIEKYNLHTFDSQEAHAIASTTSFAKKEKKENQSVAPKHSSTQKSNNKQESTLATTSKEKKKKRFKLGFLNKINDRIDEFDKKADEVVADVQHYLREDLKPRTKKAQEKEKTEKPAPAMFNGIPIHITKEGESLADISKIYKKDIRFLSQYNEGKFRSTAPLEKGTRVYLSKKADMVQSDTKEHTVQAGESLLDIAHTYGVKVKTIGEFNNLTKRSKLQEGQIIFLTKSVVQQENGNFTPKSNESDEDVEFIFSKGLGSN